MSGREPGGGRDSAGSSQLNQILDLLAIPLGFSLSFDPTTLPDDPDNGIFSTTIPLRGVAISPTLMAAAQSVADLSRDPTSGALALHIPVTLPHESAAASAMRDARAELSSRIAALQDFIIEVRAALGHIHSDTDSVSSIEQDTLVTQPRSLSNSVLAISDYLEDCMDTDSDVGDDFTHRQGAPDDFSRRLAPGSIMSIFHFSDFAEYRNYQEEALRIWLQERIDSADNNRGFLENDGSRAFIGCLAYVKFLIMERGWTLKQACQAALRRIEDDTRIATEDAQRRRRAYDREQREYDRVQRAYDREVQQRQRRAERRAERRFAETIEALNEERRQLEEEAARRVQALLERQPEIVRSTVGNTDATEVPHIHINNNNNNNNNNTAGGNSDNEDATTTNVLIDSSGSDISPVGQSPQSPDFILSDATASNSAPATSILGHGRSQALRANPAAALESLDNLMSSSYRPIDNTVHEAGSSPSDAPSSVGAPPLLVTPPTGPIRLRSRRREANLNAGLANACPPLNAMRAIRSLEGIMDERHREMFPHINSDRLSLRTSQTDDFLMEIRALQYFVASSQLDRWFSPSQCANVYAAVQGYISSIEYARTLRAAYSPAASLAPIAFPSSIRRGIDGQRSPRPYFPSPIPTTSSTQPLHLRQLQQQQEITRLRERRATLFIELADLEVERQVQEIPAEEREATLARIAAEETADDRLLREEIARLPNPFGPAMDAEQPLSAFIEALSAGALQRYGIVSGGGADDDENEDENEEYDDEEDDVEDSQGADEDEYEDEDEDEYGDEDDYVLDEYEYNEEEARRFPGFAGTTDTEVDDDIHSTRMGADEYLTPESGDRGGNYDDDEDSNGEGYDEHGAGQLEGPVGCGAQVQ